MKNNFLKVLIILYVFSIFSCHKTAFKTKVNQVYTLIAIDKPCDTMLIDSSKSIVIGSTICALGKNSGYIFLKKIPLLRNCNKKVDSSEIEYYILSDTLVNNRPVIIGPMKYAHFKTKCKKLKIKKPVFTIFPCVE